jgi:hypothetical protein
MTRAQVELSIQNNLASGSNIIASKHRQVENDILEYIATEIDAVRRENKVKVVGTVGVIAGPPVPNGDVPSTGCSQRINFPSGLVLPNADYVVCGAMGALDTNLHKETTVIFSIADKTTNGFTVAFREIAAEDQNLNFNYVVLQN